MANRIPASYHQERIWFINEFEAGYLYEAGPVYHTIPVVVDIRGELFPSLLQQSFQLLVNRNEALRTTFFSDGTNLFQQVITNAEALLKITKTLPGQTTNDILQEEIRKPFRLTEDLLLRALLIEESARQHVLVITIHHAIADRHTVRLLLDELFSNYRKLAANETLVNAEPEFQYADYVLWQKETYPEMRDYLLSHWKIKMDGNLHPLELPTDTPRAAVHVFESASQEFTLPAEVCSQLTGSQEEENSSLKLLAAFKLLMHRYCGQEEIIIGTSNVNREQDVLKQVMGPLSNLVPLRTAITGNENFQDLLQTLEQNIRESFKYNIPFDKLVLELKPGKDMSRTALFDVLFTYEEEPLVIPPSGETEFHVRENNFGWGKYDLHLLVRRNGNSFTGMMTYNSLYYTEATISQLINSYISLLGNLLKNPAAPVSEAEILSPEETARLLREMNVVKAKFPSEKTLHGLFEEQVRKTPQSIALRFNGSSITYSELNTQSNRLAHYLIAQGLQPGAIAVLLFERSVEMIVSVLAVLKAGASYLPVDPGYPEERKAFMLADSEASYLLMAGEEKIDAGQAIVLDVSAAAINDFPETDPGIAIDPATTAYIIYTSGTTGKPKGAMVSHRNVVSLLFHQPNHFDFSGRDVWTMFHSYCFDFSVWEMYGALLTGGKLVLVPKETARDAVAFYRLLAEEKVTVLNQTPGAFRNLIAADQQENAKTLCLRWIIFGGEALDPAMLAGWHNRYPATRPVNMYGITETTVHVTFKEITGKEIESGISNIGVALPTLKTYILDKNGKLVPRGVAGELFVAGEGVCKGYLRQDVLTRQKFIENPYCPGEKLYRSGDLVKQLPGGELEYLGRADDQVKIRGFRIEPAEIQNQLSRHPQVREAVVMARGENENRLLCAYYTGDETVTAAVLRKFLTGILPEYMIPSHFVRVPAIPLTSNGKIDRKALPDPQVETEEVYVAPANEIEKTLRAIWSEVLLVPEETISTGSDFFALGGHSLRATILATKIHKHLHVRVPLAEIFKAPTIQGIASFIQQATEEQYLAIPRAPQKEYYALSPAQKRLFILQQMDPGSTGYNMPMLIPVGKDFRKEKLDPVFRSLIERHESLRTSFRLNDGIPVQETHPYAGFSIDYINTTENELDKVRRDLLRPFALGTAPLMRGWLIETEAGAYLALDMHHIITDGVSQEILTREFHALYNDEELPGPALQYKDYSEWINADEQQKNISRQKDYWLKVFEGELPVLVLPYDFKRPDKPVYEGARTCFELDSSEYDQLLRICEKEEVTLFMCLLAVVSAWLSRLSGQDDIVIGNPVAARRHADLENVVGIMINTLAIRTRPSEEKTVVSFLREIKAQVLAALENQEYAFEDLVKDLSLNREASRNPLFDVMMVLQNHADRKDAGGSGNARYYGHRRSLAKFDLSVVVTELADTVLIDIDYSTQLFKAETIDRFIQYFKTIIREFCANLQHELGSTAIVSPEEEEQLLHGFNNTALDYPRELTIHQRFEQVTQEAPDAIAVVHEGRLVTYAELNARSGQFAAWLNRTHHIRPGDYVGVKLEKSEWIIVVILGILKAGAAYIPLDTAYPEERISYIMNQSGARLVIDDAALAQFRGVQADYSGENVSSRVSPSSPAYVIYTSGSTGKPKGVIIKHNGVINLNNLFLHDFKIDAGDHIMQFANFTFDASVFEMFMALLNGASLYILPDHTRKDSSRFLQFVNENKISVTILPPAYLLNIDDSGLSTLRLLITGGAPTYPELVKKWMDKVTYVNAYGPTEASVCVTCARITDPSRITIGGPNPNTSIYILNQHRQLQPVGIAGELCIGGDGLAIGYLANPELTEKSFIPNPYMPGEKIYRTGDLARWLPDGSIEFIGRNDNQVKVSGYRIELGEIENQLLTHPDIREAVAIVRGEKENKSICAYYVSGKEHDQEELRMHLAKTLPGYMIPSYFLQIEKIPLTSHGKLDKKALPDPVHKTAAYVAPKNDTEELLTNVWSEILGIDKSSISTHSNFFELGGNSLKVISLNNRLNELKICDDVVRLFTYPTISSFLASLGMKEEETVDRQVAIKQGRVIRRKQQEKRKL